jgi:hypothetical protein
VDQASVVSLATAELAAEIAKKVSTASPEQLAEASSKIDEAFKGTEGAPQDIKTASHGFKQFKAPDGTAAIEVKITRMGFNRIWGLKRFRNIPALLRPRCRGSQTTSKESSNNMVSRWIH